MVGLFIFCPILFFLDICGLMVVNDPSNASKEPWRGNVVLILGLIVIVWGALSYISTIRSPRE